MTTFKDYRVGTMTLVDMNGIEDEAERTRVQGWIVDALNFWPDEIKCDGLAVDCSGSLIPSISFAVYEGGELIGVWYVMRIKIVEGQTFGHIMPGFHKRGEDDFEQRTVRIIRAMLTKPVLETTAGAKLSFDILHFNIVDTLERDERDQRVRSLWAKAQARFIAEDAGVIDLAETFKVERPNVRGIYMHAPGAAVAVGKD